MNDLDQLLRSTLSERADQAPPAGPVIDRALTDTSDHRSWGRLPLVAAGVAATVAAGAFGATALWPDDSSPDVATQPGLGAGASLLERCLHLGADALPDEHWGAGSEVLTFASDGEQTRAAIVSADGTQWADCHLLNPAGDQGILSTYPMEPADQGSSEFNYSTDSNGPLSFSMLERFPDNVAEVRLVFASGREFTAEAVDGFVAFQVEDDSVGGTLDKLLQYDASGQLVGGPGLAGGDADLPLEQRSLVPAYPLDSVEVVPNQ